MYFLKLYGAQNCLRRLHDPALHLLKGSIRSKSLSAAWSLDTTTASTATFLLIVCKLSITHEQVHLWVDVEVMWPLKRPALWLIVVEKKPLLHDEEPAMRVEPKRVLGKYRAPSEIKALSTETKLKMCVHWMWFFETCITWHAYTPFASWQVYVLH